MVLWSASAMKVKTLGVLFWKDRRQSAKSRTIIEWASLRAGLITIITALDWILLLLLSLCCHFSSLGFFHLLRLHRSVSSTKTVAAHQWPAADRCCDLVSRTKCLFVFYSGNRIPKTRLVSSEKLPLDCWVNESMSQWVFSTACLPASGRLHSATIGGGTELKHSSFLQKDANKGLNLWRTSGKII